MKTDPAPSDDDPSEIDRWFSEGKTLAEVYWLCTKGRLESVVAGFPIEKREAFLAGAARLYQPWPNWIFPVGAEVWHVDYPTIPKQLIEDSLSGLHFLIFEVRLDGSTPKDAFPKLDMEVFPKIFGKVIGHIAAQIVQWEPILDRLLADKLLTPEEHAEFKQKISLEAFQKEIAPQVARYLESRPEGLLPINEGIAEAKANTFDKAERKPL